MAKLFRAQDRVLGGLGDAKLHDPLGGNFDGLARGRVAAYAGFAVHQHQLWMDTVGPTILGSLRWPLAAKLSEPLDSHWSNAP